MMEQTPAEYVRSLIEKEGEYISGRELYKRLESDTGRRKATAK